MATAGKIEDQIWDQVRRAEAVVADLTGSNPNVYYEVGLAHALGKRIIFITQDDTPLPFDVLTSRYIKYAESDLGQLQNELERAFAAVKQRYQFDPRP
jgi:nucleoside 2-deoxyribosyltransferase